MFVCHNDAMRLLWASVLAAATAVAQVPVTWDEDALRDWATPIAALGVRPGHFTAAEYHRAPLDNFRTYPVYFPGREPEGYRERLQRMKPQRLIESKRMRTAAEWVADGERAFAEYDNADSRSYDPKKIALARSEAYYAETKEQPLPDGTVGGLRWVVTDKGIALTISNCALCHTRWIGEKPVIGAPYNYRYSSLIPSIAPAGVSFVSLPGDKGVPGFFRSYKTPWIEDDEHQKLMSMKLKDFGEITRRSLNDGMFARWNGSPFYPTKVPDLIGIKDRMWIDATGTHRHRGPGDMMRYGALISYADASDFGSHRILTDEQRRVPSRLPDEVWYAMTMYMYSLQPPTNPNAFDEKAARGKKVFEAQGCNGCHPAPLYTNNKLTLAAGYRLPDDSPMREDVLPISVGTDSGLAMKTRKGTGFYKVPSLKGLWYRGRYLHDGSFTTLEEMFDPRRLSADFAPSGWNPLGQEHRAITGHEFGLKITESQRADLLAFLRTI